MTRRAVITQALADGKARLEAERAEAEQLDLLAAQAPMITRKPMESDEAFAARSDAIVQRRRVGRPPGSESLATKELRDYALRFGPHPMLALMKVADLGPRGLAEELGCTMLEAFDRWERVVSGLRKAFTPDMAPTDGAGNAVPLLTMVMAGQALQPGQPLPDGIRAPWLDNVDDAIDVQTADGQPVPEAAPAQLRDGSGR